MPTRSVALALMVGNHYAIDPELWVQEPHGRYRVRYAAYDAPSREAALQVPPSRRASPRTGCNGYPFSRMRRADTAGLDGDQFRPKA